MSCLLESRFWWQNRGVFSSYQRDALLNVSLSAIICDNTRIQLVPSDPFSRTLHPNDMLPCTDARIRRMNLTAWREADAGTDVGVPVHVVYVMVTVCHCFQTRPAAGFHGCVWVIRCCVTLLSSISVPPDTCCMERITSPVTPTHTSGALHHPPAWV